MRLRWRLEAFWLWVMNLVSVLRGPHATHYPFLFILASFFHRPALQINPIHLYPQFSYRA